MGNLDRRESPRTVLEKILTIQLEQDNHAIVLNLSDGGLGFHAVQPVQGIDAIQFSFSPPNHERVQATGELVWRDVTKKTGGLRLSALPASTREQIRSWALQAMGPSAPVLREPPIPAPRYPVAAKDAGGAELSAFPLRSLGSSGPASDSRSDFPQPAIAEDERAQPRADLPPADLLSTDLRALVNSRPKFLSGFVTGAAVSALAMMVLFSVYGGQITAGLAELRARIGGGTPALEPVQRAATAPAAPVPGVAAGSALASLPSGDSPAAPGSGEAAAPARAADATDAPLAELRKADDAPAGAARVVRPVPGGSTKIGNRDRTLGIAGDTGEKELAIAQGYLSGHRGATDGAAVAFLWSAVEKGNVDAEVTLAGLYARGEGVARSCDQARVLLDAAAGKGSGEADRQLAQIARERCK